MLLAEMFHSHPVYAKAPRPVKIEDVVVDVVTLLLMGHGDDFWDCRTSQKELDKLVGAMRKMLVTSLCECWFLT